MRNFGIAWYRYLTARSALTRSDVEGFQPLDWANARMRALYGATLKKGWWRLLWMPPSLPYHQLGGAYASIDSTEITKQLIFSSWVAAPAAIASLLSYEVQRQIFTGAGHGTNTPAARAALSRRLDYRMADGRPASMSTLALFWPQPTVAELADPLDAARDHAESPSVERLLEWASDRVEAVVGSNGSTNSTASAVWHWFAPVQAERGSALASALIGEWRGNLADALRGASPDHWSEEERGEALVAHVRQLQEALGDWTPESERPADLVATSALLGLGAPGNIAWRALKRLRRTGDAVTELGHWRAAAILASGLRSLFARPNATLLLDNLYGGASSARADEGAYWRRVARYCIDGGTPGGSGRVHPPPGR